MINLEITKVENHKYFLFCKECDLMFTSLFEFYGITSPKVGDTISLDEKLLDPYFEGYCQPYAFELVHNRNDFDENKKTEFAILCTNDKKYLLRRIYG